MKIKRVKINKGSILVITLLILGVMLFLSSYFITFSLTGSRMSHSHQVGTEAYYLAEAGINQAIWKLKNDDIWSTCFVTSSDVYGCSDCKGWSATFTASTDQLVPNSSVVVTIQNSTLTCASGEIITTSTIALAGGKTAQRVVKTKVVRNLGSLTENSPLFTGSPSGESTIRDSLMNIYNGNMFIKNNLKIKGSSTVNVYDNPLTDIQEGKVLVAGNCLDCEGLIISGNLNSSSVCAKDICYTTSTCGCEGNSKFQECTAAPSPGRCPPEPVGLPPAVLDSYRSKAENAQNCKVVGKDHEGNQLFDSNKCVFEGYEFRKLLDDVGLEGTLILGDETDGSVASTYYVKGWFAVLWGKHLEINGVLVSDKTVDISDGYLTVNDPGLGIPSGLLTQKWMIVSGGLFSQQVFDVEGLLYSEREMSLISSFHTINIKGGIIANKFSSKWSDPLNIYFDEDIIKEGMWGGSQPPSDYPLSYSPVITVEHWEESY